MTTMLLRERCQRENLLGDHPPLRRLKKFAFVAIDPYRKALRAKLAHTPPRKVWREGTPSRFAVGSLVRVKDADAIRETLDAEGKTKGLLWMDVQWATCGKVFRVGSHLREMIDDYGVRRIVHRTTILQDATCEFDHPNTLGCGRDCPLFYRDEWLEEAAPGDEPYVRPAAVKLARVRSVEEIRATLDPFGRRDGLQFMREMERFAGTTAPVVHRITRDEYDMVGGWAPVTKPFYVLQGLVCNGEAIAPQRCERQCTLIWHADWLTFES